MWSRKNIHALALAAVTVLLAGAALPVKVGDNPAALPAGKAEAPPLRGPAVAPPSPPRVRRAPHTRITPAASLRAAPAATAPASLAVIAVASETSDTATAGHSGDTMGDALIEARIKNELFARTGRSSFLIEVESADGVVSLSGPSPNRTSRDRALRIARELSGGREVRDLLNIKPAAAAE